MGFFDIFKSKKKVESAAERREFLLAKGRITDGAITDSETLDTGEEVVFYYYSVHGADYESSEILTAEQRANPLKYAPGAKVGIRFDPKNHANSIVI